LPNKASLAAFAAILPKIKLVASIILSILAYYPQILSLGIFFQRKLSADYLYAVDVKSIFFSVKYAAPEMRKTGGGVIINTASNSVNNPTPGMSCYISSKGAVIALTRVLAVELAPDNIRVNCVSPSLTDTAMVKYVKQDPAMAEWLKTMVSRIPLGQRLVKPEEIALAALYLASDEASMTSGINLIVDGASGL